MRESLVSRSFGKSHWCGALFAVLTLVVSLAHAQWLEGTVTEIQAYPDASSSPLSYPVVIVYANLTPSAGCTYPAFLLLPGDPMYKETYATLLTAKVSSAKIKYFHA